MPASASSLASTGMWIAEATVAEADGFGKYLTSDPDTAGPDRQLRRAAFRQRDEA